MGNRYSFAQTINELTMSSNLSASECETFGMTWGCKPDCPVFERGECKDCFSENIEQFIKEGDIELEEANSLIGLYKNRLSDGEITYLSELINKQIKKL